MRNHCESDSAICLHHSRYQRSICPVCDMSKSMTSFAAPQPFSNIGYGVGCMVRIQLFHSEALAKNQRQEPACLQEGSKEELRFLVMYVTFTRIPTNLQLIVVMQKQRGCAVAPLNVRLTPSRMLTGCFARVDCAASLISAASERLEPGPHLRNLSQQDMINDTTRANHFPSLAETIVLISVVISCSSSGYGVPRPGARSAFPTSAQL